MRVFILVLWAMVISWLGGCAAAPARSTLLLDQGWRFHKGDVPGAEKEAFADQDWRPVTLPHDWGVEGPFGQEWASGQGYLPGGIGWYRGGFNLAADQTPAAGKRVVIRFNGVYKHSQVWCNGELSGGRPYGYISFDVDVTKFVRAGHNEIAVRVDHSDFADSRWYTGSGIYRDVFLIVTDPVHVDRYGTVVTTEGVVEKAMGPTGRQAAVGVEAAVKDEESEAQSLLPMREVRVLNRLLDSNGVEVGRLDQTKRMVAGERQVFSGNVDVNGAEFWSVDSPTMYRMVTEVRKDGKVVDSYETPFGIRSFKFDPNKGFSLNGQPMKLKGVCVHEEAGALGAAVPIAVWKRRLSILKEAGCNAIRCSHNPPDPEFLDLCDRMGFLVMDEAFDEWTRGKNKWVAGRNVGTASKDGYNRDFAEWSDTDITDMVLRDRNHPSIIMWSIGNEIDYQNDPYPPNSRELPPIAAKLIADVKSMDTTRPVTAACAAVPTNLWIDQLDVAGYNYQEQLYAADHAAHPQRIIYGSENSQNFQAWDAVKQNAFIAGQFLWTGIDYLGEAAAWPNRGSGAGILDLAGFKKRLFYQRQAWWSDKPMAHIEAGGGGGRGRGAAGGGAGEVVYSNCESVALYHDGVLIGEQAVPANGQVNGTYVLTSGTLRAVGKKGGKEICSDQFTIAGPAKKIRLLPDVQSIHPDGPDVAQIEVDITDENGVRVPDAANLVQFAVSGSARIIGIENGDQNSHEDYKAPSHHAYQGRMLVYLQSLNGGTGEITLSAASAGLEGQSVQIALK